MIEWTQVVPHNCGLAERAWLLGRHDAGQGVDLEDVRVEEMEKTFRSGHSEITRDQERRFRSWYRTGQYIDS